MKNQTTLLIALIALFIVSCATKKNVDNEKLYHTAWELEYISGPRIAFIGLYPDKKPEITFEKTTKKVTGNNSCNGYSAEYTLSGDSISFGEPGPATLMYCGEGESVFMNMMQKINKYSVDQDGKLNLMIDNVSVMRFKKTNIK